MYVTMEAYSDEAMVSIHTCRSMAPYDETMVSRHICMSQWKLIVMRQWYQYVHVGQWHLMMRQWYQDIYVCHNGTL